MQVHKKVESSQNVTNVNWQNELKVLDDYAQYGSRYAELLYELNTICNGYLGAVKAAWYRI